MFEIQESPGIDDLEMIDFGIGGKPLFSLPRLGQPGVPVGLMSAFAVFYDRYQSGGGRLSGDDVVHGWNLLIGTLADVFPTACRQLARLDETQIAGVVAHWVAESEGFDPKA